MSTKKFLEFNGKAVYFLAKSGTYWIAIKPICEALEVQFVRQFKNAKKHPFFSKVLSKQTIPTEGGMQKMICIPERYVYGWLFQIRSESKGLAEYQKQCCDILFDYFHGSITSRETLIREKTKEELEEERLERELINQQP